MSDIAIRWDAAAMGGDFALEAAQLALDDSLDTAIIISLFSDARAREGDGLPQGSDPRGWWGDAWAAEAGDVLGSRLWLLAREKRLASVLNRARDYALEALAWLVEDAVVRSVEVETELRGLDQIAILITLTRPDGPGRERYDYVWDRTIAAHALGAAT